MDKLEIKEIGVAEIEKLQLIGKKDFFWNFCRKKHQRKYAKIFGRRIYIWKTNKWIIKPKL